MDNNGFTGSLPDSLSGIDPQYFTVSFNQLSGTLPAFVSQWKKCVRLRVFACECALVTQLVRACAALSRST